MKSCSIDLMKRFNPNAYIHAFLLFATISCNTTQPAQSGGSKQCKGKGESVIIGGNTIEAKEQATTKALEDCLRKAIGVYLESNTVIDNGQLAYSSIIANAKGYLESYQILSETKSRSMYEVEVSGYANEEKIDSAFFKRTEKVIEKNPIGPCTLGIYMNRNSQFDSSNLVCAVNDISTSPNSIFIKLPNRKWEKIAPNIFGVAQVIQIDFKGKEIIENSDLLKSLIDGSTIGFQFQVNGSDQIRESKTTVETISGYAFESPIQNVQISKPLSRATSNKQSWENLQSQFDKMLEYAQSNAIACNFNFQTSKEDGEKKYSINFFCFNQTLDLSGLVIPKFGGKLQEIKLGEWDVLDFKESINLFCRNRFEKSNCRQILLDALENPKIFYSSSKVKKGIMVIDTISCETDTVNFSQIKLNGSDEDKKKIQDCKKEISKN